MMQPTLVIGVDPDKDTPAFASVLIGADYSIKVWGVKVQVPNYGVGYRDLIPPCEPWTPVRIFIESPEAVYTKGKGIRVQDIVELARRAGECSMHLLMERGSPGYPSGTYNAQYTTPADWKGQVPKGVSQARICKRLDWAYEMKAPSDPYAYPVGGIDFVLGGGSLKQSDWKHVMDAIGIALWGADTIINTHKRAEAIARNK